MLDYNAPALVLEMPFKSNAKFRLLSQSDVHHLLYLTRVDIPVTNSSDAAIILF